MSFVKLDVNLQLVELFKLVFPEVIENKSLDQKSTIELMNGIFGANSQWFGLKDQDNIIAFCTVGRTPNHAIIFNFGVLKQYRNKGYGFKLMEHIIDKFKSTNICLFVNKTNRIAIWLYRKFHFEYTDTAFQSPLGQICMIRPVSL